MTKLGLGKVRALFPIIPSYQKRLYQLLLTQPLFLFNAEPKKQLKEDQNLHRRHFQFPSNHFQFPSNLSQFPSKHIRKKNP